MPRIPFLFPATNATADPFKRHVLTLPLSETLPMKTKKFFLSMLLASLSVPASFAQAQTFGSGSSVGHISDDSQSISDQGSSNLYRADNRPAEFRNNYVNTAAPHDAGLMTELTSPTSFGTADSYSSGSCGTGSYGTTGACSPAACKPSRPMRLRGMGLTSSTWGEFDTLLWWRSASQYPALVSQNPNVAQLPTLDTAGTEVLSGGSAIVNDMMVGYRAGFGAWLNDAQTFGVGGRVFGSFNGSNSNTYTSAGTPSLGIPFFNTSLSAEDAYVVAVATNGSGNNTGSITATEDFSFFGTEAYARIALARTGTAKFDLLGGYQFTRIDDSIGLQTTSVNGVTDLITDGTQFDTNDQFATENTFHGGLIGLMASVQKKKWTVSSSTRVAIGNMTKSYDLSGSVVTTDPGGAVTTANRGILVYSSNAGVRSTDVFTFIPQFDLKLGYQVSDSLRFDVGYSLLYFTDIALAGSQIDRNVDFAAALANPAFPQVQTQRDAIHLHGLTLGGTFSF